MIDATTIKAAGRMLKSGMPPKQIAAELGIRVGSVYRWRAKLGIKSGPGAKKLRIEKELGDLSDRAVAQKCGASRAYVWDVRAGRR